MKPEQLSLLHERLHQIVGHINAILPHLHQLTLDIASIERMYDAIDTNIQCQSLEKVKEAMTNGPKDFDMKAFVEFAKTIMAKKTTTE